MHIVNFMVLAVTYAITVEEQQEIPVKRFYIDALPNNRNQDVSRVQQSRYPTVQVDYNANGDRIPRNSPAMPNRARPISSQGYPVEDYQYRPNRIPNQGAPISSQGYPVEDYQYRPNQGAPISNQGYPVEDYQYRPNRIPNQEQLRPPIISQDSQPQPNLVPVANQPQPSPVLNQKQPQPSPKQQQPILPPDTTSKPPTTPTTPQDPSLITSAKGCVFSPRLEIEDDAVYVDIGFVDVFNTNTTGPFGTVFMKSLPASNTRWSNGPFHSDTYNNGKCIGPTKGPDRKWCVDVKPTYRQVTFHATPQWDPLLACNYKTEDYQAVLVPLLQNAVASLARNNTYYEPLKYVRNPFSTGKSGHVTCLAECTECHRLPEKFSVVLHNRDFGGDAKIQVYIESNIDSPGHQPKPSKFCQNVSPWMGLASIIPFSPIALLTQAVTFGCSF